MTSPFIVGSNNESFNKALPASLDKNRLPEHIAIIMDGNGRWAKVKKLPRAMGHTAGVDALKKTATKHGNNIIIAADEDSKYFDKYEMPRSLARVSLGILISPLRMMRAVFKGYAAPSFNGAFNAVPVDLSLIHI